MRLLSNLFTSYRSKILVEFFKDKTSIRKSYLVLFLPTSTLVHPTKICQFSLSIHVFEMKTECCSHSWHFWVILVTSICHLQTNYMKVSRLEMEPFGTETNVSEMLKYLNEFTHSNHFVPKMLTLQNLL